MIIKRSSATMLSATLLLASSVQAMTLSFESPIGEFVEGFPVSVRIRLETTGMRNCGAAHYVPLPEGRVLDITLDAAGCVGNSIGFDRPLAQGTYLVRVVSKTPEGAVVEAAEGVVTIQPLVGRCNLDPDLPAAILGPTRGGPAATERAAALMADGNIPEIASGAIAAWPRDNWVAITLPAPHDPVPLMPYLDATYAWYDDWSNADWGTVSRNSRVCKATSSDLHATVVEFAHAGIGSYFYSKDAGEIAMLDAGGAWKRTGQSFGVIAEPSCASAHGQGVVYRFWGAPNVGPRAHLFTQDRQECHAVSKSAHWVYENVAFWTERLQAGGACLPGSDGRPRVPLYRVWRPFGESLHRLTTDPLAVQEMIAKGWIDEGPRMCVQSSGGS